MTSSDSNTLSNDFEILGKKPISEVETEYILIKS